MTFNRIRRTVCGLAGTLLLIGLAFSQAYAQTTENSVSPVRSATTSAPMLTPAATAAPTLRFTLAVGIELSDPDPSVNTVGAECVICEVLPCTPDTRVGTGSAWLPVANGAPVRQTVDIAIETKPGTDPVAAQVYECTLVLQSGSIRGKPDTYSSQAAFRPDMTKPFKPRVTGILRTVEVVPGTASGIVPTATPAPNFLGQLNATLQSTTPGGTQQQGSSAPPPRTAARAQYCAKKYSGGVIPLYSDRRSPYSMCYYGNTD